MSGAKDRMLTHLLSNVGKLVPRDDLARVGAVHDWARSVRTLRQDGWDIEQVSGKRGGYILHSDIKKESNKHRGTISGKLRYEVLQRDNSRCQRCGRTVGDGIVLNVDHKIPVEWGGATTIDNLWTLCNICNGGKKHFFADFDSEVMKEVIAETTGSGRLRTFFKLNPGVVIEPVKLEVVSGIRDWERTLRYIRKKEGMDIEWIRPDNKELPAGGYRYNKN